MTEAEILVTAGGAALIAALGWFFFGPKQARRAEVRGNVQEVQIDVKGGYSPNLIRVHRGVPLRLVFEQQTVAEFATEVERIIGGRVASLSEEEAERLMREEAPPLT